MQELGSLTANPAERQRESGLRGRSVPGEGNLLLLHRLASEQTTNSPLVNRSIPELWQRRAT